MAYYLLWNAGIINTHVMYYNIETENIIWYDKMLNPFLTKKYMEDITA